MKERTIFFLFCFILSVTCNSQNISVSSFRLLETDLTANIDGSLEKDYNGETAALIKVVTTQAGFLFDCGIIPIVKVVKKPAEIWVYVPRGIMKLNISNSLLGVMSEYYLPMSIESGRTYEMVLQIGDDKNYNRQNPLRQYVIFRLTPTDAIIEINGDTLTSNDGIVSTVLGYGTYDYQVKATDYHPVKGTVSVNNSVKKKVIDITLIPNIKYLDVKEASNQFGQIIIDADSIIKIGDQCDIRYKYKYRDSIDRVVQPNWNWENSGLYDVLSEPRKFSVSSQVFEKKEYEETYTISLRFLKEGVINVPSMSIHTASGEIISSNSFSVRVTSQNEERKRKGTKRKDWMLVEVSVDKKVITQGDSIMCEICLYSNTIPLKVSLVEPLAINNAYIVRLNNSLSLDLKKAEFKGEKVYCVLIDKFAIIPFQTGIFSLDPMSFNVKLLKQTLDNPSFEFFSGKSPYFKKDTIISTREIFVQVKRQNNPLNNISIVTPTPMLTHKTGIVIDRSSSLLTTEDSLSDTYFQLEERFLKQIIKDRKEGEFSYMTFSAKPHNANFKDDRPAILAAPSKENDGSAIYDAVLASALQEGAMSEGHAPFSILLLTDGYDNMSHISEKTLINLLLQNHIRVDVVAFASKKDSIYSIDYTTNGVKDSLKVKHLKIENTQNFMDVERIADATNGVFILIENESQLPEAIQKVEERLSLQLRPEQQPDINFSPDLSILYKLYNELLSVIKSSF